MGSLLDHQLDEGTQRRTCRRRTVTVVTGTVVLAAIMAVAVLDGLGAVDAFGVDTAIVTDHADDTTLTVRHPSVTRPALASPFEVTVQRAGGFTGDSVEVAVTTGYLLAWDLNAIIPSPSAETADAERTIWTFDVPDGDTLVIRYEARIEPARQSAVDARVAVLDPGDGTELVAVELTTRIRP